MLISSSLTYGAIFGYLLEVWINLTTIQLKQNIMSSKNTKKIVKAGLESVPVHPIKLTLSYELKDPKGIESVTNKAGKTTRMEDLPKALTCDITITTLKGWQYGAEWVKIENDFNLTYYKCKGIEASSRSGEKVKTTYLALTSGVGLLNFMLNNGVKLYILPTENKLGTSIRDRNYAEIVGLFQFEADQVDKAYCSTTMTSSMKKDIRDIRDSNKVIDNEVIAASPLRKARIAVAVIVSTEKLMSYREAQKAIGKGNKIFLLKAK